MTTENLSTLKIHKLTQTQYDRELANGNLDKSALYLTPDEESDLSLYATIEQMNGKADVDHTHTAAEVGARPSTWMPTPEDIGAGRVNPNLLDNWYFGNPVDQRGGYVVPPGTAYYGVPDGTSIAVTQTYYTATIYNTYWVSIIVDGTTYYVPRTSSVRGYTGSGYTIDRWKNNYPAGVVTITDKGVTLGAMKWLSHRFENNELYGKTLTASALFSDGEFCYGTAVYNGGDSRFCYTVDYAVYLELVDHGGATAPEFRLVNYNETAEKTVVAVKLELGTQQTLAHQDENGNWVLNEIPNYDEQLLRCCMSTADSSDEYANNKKTAANVGAMSTFDYNSATTNYGESLDFNTLVGIGVHRFPGDFHLIKNAPEGAWVGDSAMIVTDKVAARCCQLLMVNTTDWYFRRCSWDGTWPVKWYKIATTDYALPRDGSAAMTGALKFYTNKGFVATEYNNDVTTTYLMSLFGGKIYKLDVGNSGPRYIEGTLDDQWANPYPILHTGNYGSLMAGGTISGNLTVNGTLTGTTVKGAIWNDYAEYREADTLEPGRVVCENGDDTLSLSTERLQAGANIISDTFGFSIGETELAKTPIAVSGRVLAYPYEDRDSYKPGDAVCAAPNGTVSKMTREEIREYPDRIVGTVSSVPQYETWGTGNVPVNGRIWIKVK